MAITPTKTWEYSVNFSATGVDLTARNTELWLRLKEMLTDTGSAVYLDAAGAALGTLTSPWVVIASSNGVTADATDNWATVADIVGAAAGVAHSWIHLRQVDYFGVGDHLNLLLADEDVTTHAIGLVAWSRGAAGWNADGTTTNRPTPAVGSTEIKTRRGLVVTGDAEASDAMWGNDSVNDTRVLQFRIADDGSAGGWWMFDSGNCTMLAGWQNDEGGPASGRANPFTVWTYGTDNTVDINVWASFWNTIPGHKTLDEGNIEVELDISMALFGTSEQLMTGYNDGGDGSRFFGQILFRHSATNRILGALTDTWWGSDNNLSGDGAPITPPVVWRSVGHQIIPWPSGVAMTVS